MSAWRLLLGDVLVLVGTAAMSLAVLGILRIGDTHARVHAASKAVVLGVVPVLLAALAASDAVVAGRALLVGLFLITTTPVGSHALVRLLERTRGPAHGS